MKATDSMYTTVSDPPTDGHSDGKYTKQIENTLAKIALATGAWRRRSLAKERERERERERGGADIQGIRRKCKETDRRADGRKDKQTDRRTDSQTDGGADRQTFSIQASRSFLYSSGTSETNRNM